MGLGAQCAVRGGCDDGNIVAYAEQIALLTLGRDTCGNWDGASRYEWLVTNGLGGFACGTVGGANTRRYHGFLVASLNPPVERMLLVEITDTGTRIMNELLVRLHASEREWFDMLTQAEQQTFIELMGRVQARFQQLQHSFKP